MLRTSYQATETSTESSAPTRSLRTGLQFTANRKELAALVRRLSSVADKKSRLAILGYVAMRSGLSGVTLATTDLDVWCVIDAPHWTVEGAGGYCVPAKDLGNVLRTLPDGDVTFAAVDGGVRVSAGSVEVTLQGIPDRDFPKIPTLPAQHATVDGEALGEMIESVNYAICKDQTRFHLAGILFEYDGVTARMVATDGHRLAKSQRELPQLGTFSTKGVILREKACKEMGKLLAKSGTVEIGINGPLFSCSRNAALVTTTITSKMVDAQFPPYEQVIPTTNARRVTVDRERLLGAVERSKALCSDARGLSLSLGGSIGTPSLELIATHPDKGKFHEAIEASYNDDRMCIGFDIGANPRYLAETLAALTCERVTIEMSNNDAPCKYAHNLKESQLCPILVRAESDTSRVNVHVIMPMRM